MRPPTVVASVLVGLLLRAALSAAAEETPAPGTERGIAFSQPGRIAVILDRDVYEEARADLGDLRLLDDQDRQVPYLLQRTEVEPPVAPRYPTVHNRAFVRGQSATVTLDFGSATLKDELHLKLSGQNFRRRVVVEGRSRRDPGWMTLTDDAYVFAIPDPGGARYEIVRLPENNYQLLRVTVLHGDGDPERIEIEDAWTRPEPRRRPREVPLSPRFTRSENAKARETLLVLDLGARHQPFRGLQLDVRDSRLFRSVVVDTRVEPRGPLASGQELAWQYLADGVVYRHGEPGTESESLRLDVTGRARVIRLTVRNRDDAPLDVSAVTVLVPIERLAFEAQAGRTYRLTYGAPGLESPSYDLARTAGDPSLWSARAEEARLLAPTRRAPGAASARPWTERHPALLWGGLLTVVALMAAVTWHALRTAA